MVVILALFATFVISKVHCECVTHKCAGRDGVNRQNEGYNCVCSLLFVFFISYCLRDRLDTDSVDDSQRVLLMR